MLVTSPHPPSPGCKIQEIGKFATKHFRFCRGCNFGISNQRDEKTWPYQQKDKDNDNNNDKDNLRDLWPLRHCIQFRQLNSWQSLLKHNDVDLTHCWLSRKPQLAVDGVCFPHACGSLNQPLLYYISLNYIAIALERTAFTHSEFAMYYI